ncbi:MAG: hypothetical protein PHF29_05085 [Candidatus Riflebacteria bacterium]|nr:hypothetical protein [Candidatus Riflebacteria bacterium]
MISSQSHTTRLMIYAMVCTLIVAFGAIGSIIASSSLGEQYALMGLFIGSALGAFISVYESTIIGCIVGMIVGAISAPLVFYFIDLETACLLVFTIALLGAILGEPIATFWRETQDDTEDSKRDTDSEELENQL